MEGETAIERSIKDFVFSKIQEQVLLEFPNSGTILIKPRAKQGSTALAMFWLRVLRHKNNYPMPKYPYKEVYDKQGYNKVILKVDSMCLTTFMTSGLLMLQGTWTLEWFINTFPDIMAAYDAAPRVESRLASTVYRQYTESWKDLQTEDRQKKAVFDEEEREKIRRSMEILEGEEQTGVKEQKDDETFKESSVRECVRLAAEEEAEEVELMTLNVWPEEVLQAQLHKLQACRVKDGATYIYPLWKSLLHAWFSDPTRKVFIVTPRLDVKRLSDICNIVLEHRIPSHLESVYVSQQCDTTLNIHAVKQRTLEQYKAQDQMYLEYKVFSAIIYPAKPFHAKFIGCIKGNEAEVLVTSSNFHGDHFEHASMDTVLYQQMSDVAFISKFLSPINASIHDQD